MYKKNRDFWKDPYFKLYNNQKPSAAKEMNRLSFYADKLRVQPHRQKQEKLKITSQVANDINDILRSEIRPGYRVWDYLHDCMYKSFMCDTDRPKDVDIDLCMSVIPDYRNIIGQK